MSNTDQLITLRIGIDAKTLKVDKENRQLNGVVAIEPIDIKDYRSFTIDDDFIQDLVKFASRQKDGVLSNFGHNWNNLGRRLGRAKNWRVEEGKAKYDLHVFQSADKAPGMQGMGSYVLDMAEEDDKSMMNSIVFKEEMFFQKTADGQKLKVWYWDKKLGYIQENPALGKVYVKFKSLASTDIVDEGAATNSMFSMENENKSVLQKLKDSVMSIFDDGALQEHFAADAIPIQAAAIQSPEQSTNSDKNMSNETTPVAAPAAAPVQQDINLQKIVSDAIAPIADTLKDISNRLTVVEKSPIVPDTPLNTGAGGGAPTDNRLWLHDPINIQALKQAGKDDLIPLALSHDFTEIAAYQAYVQTFGTQILHRALMDFETAKYVNLMPGIKGKHTFPRSRKNGSVVRGYNGNFDGIASSSLGNVTVEVDVFKTELNIMPLDMLPTWMGELLRRGTNAHDFPIQQFFLDRHAEYIAEEMEIAIWQGVKDGGAAANAPIIEKMDGFIKRFQAAITAGNTPVNTGAITTDSIVEQLTFMYTHLDKALKQKKSKVYCYLSTNHEIQYFEKRGESLKFITDQYMNSNFNLANMELVFLPGIPDNIIAITQMPNLIYAFDDMNDISRWFWKQQHYTMEASALMKAGTQVEDTDNGFLILNEQVALFGV